MNNKQAKAIADKVYARLMGQHFHIGTVVKNGSRTRWGVIVAVDATHSTREYSVKWNGERGVLETKVTEDFVARNVVSNTHGKKLKRLKKKGII